MASIGNFISSAYDQLTGTGKTSAAGSGSSSSGNSSTASSTSGADPLANQSTFLTLLVSQLKNQNPMSPMDGTTFVTQLAQFSDLEQNLAMRQDLDSLTAKYANPTTPASPTASGGSSPTANS